ncbi:MAG: MarR family transcriptional regulator [Chloroflexota bacterium]
MPNPPIADLERLVMGSVAITERAIAASGTDLTFVQWRVLLIVGDHEDGATIGEIASRIGAHASPASRLISRLRGRGVVATTKDADDGRVTLVRLTEAGRELRTRVIQHRRRDLADLAELPDVGLTSRDRAAIARLARAFESYT